MRKTYLRGFCFSLMCVIDQGKYTRITLHEMFRLCESRKIIEWLQGEFPELFTELHDDEQNALILEALARYSNATTASKYSIENSGICLLVNWLSEMRDSEPTD